MKFTFISFVVDSVLKRRCFNYLVVLEFMVCGAVEFNWIIFNVQFELLNVVHYDEV